MRNNNVNWLDSKRHVVHHKLPRGGLPAVANHVALGPLLVYDLAALTPQLLPRWHGESADALGIIVDADRATAASGAWSEATIRDSLVMSNSGDDSIPRFAPQPLAISRDSRMTALLCNNRLTIRTYPDGALLRSLRIGSEDPDDECLRTTATFDAADTLWYVREGEEGEYVLAALLPTGDVVEAELSGFRRYQVGFELRSSLHGELISLTVYCQDGAMGGCWCRVAGGAIEFVSLRGLNTCCPHPELLGCHDGSLAACELRGNRLYGHSLVLPDRRVDIDIPFEHAIRDLTQIGPQEILVALDDRSCWHVDPLTSHTTRLVPGGYLVSVLPTRVSPRQLCWLILTGPSTQRPEQLAVEVWELPDAAASLDLLRAPRNDDLVRCAPPAPLLTDEGYLRPAWIDDPAAPGPREAPD